MVRKQIGPGAGHPLGNMGLEFSGQAQESVKAVEGDVRDMPDFSGPAYVHDGAIISSNILWSDHPAGHQ